MDSQNFQLRNYEENFGFLYAIKALKDKYDEERFRVCSNIEKVPTVQIEGLLYCDTAEEEFHQKQKIFFRNV